MPDRTLGLILAGGLSRRMEGQEKSLMTIGKSTLIERARERLKNQVSQILLNANGDPARFDFLGLPISPDTIDGFAGPLAGVLSGLRWAENKPEIEWILTVAADTPFFPTDYASRMFTSSADSKIVLAASNNRKHPVFGLWHKSLADDLEKFLQDGGRKVMLFVDQYPNSLVEFSDSGIDPFFNVNTPDDLIQAELFLKEEDYR